MRTLKKLLIEEFHKYYSVPSVIKNSERKNETFVMCETCTSEV